jgi:hypothetical protein
VALQTDVGWATNSHAYVQRFAEYEYRVLSSYGQTLTIKEFLPATVWKTHKSETRFDFRASQT